MKRNGIVMSIVGLLATACSSSTSFTDGNSPAGDYTHCGAVTATCNAFYSGTRTACTQAARDQCSTFEPTYSEAFRSATVSCARTFSPCIQDFHDCARKETVRATPTLAQAKVKADFCKACPDPVDASVAGTCSTFFTVEVPDGGGRGAYGAGSLVLFVNDVIAEEIGRACVSAASCGFAFLMCATAIRQDRTTPDACRK